MSDDTVGYFNKLAEKTAPLRKESSSSSSTPSGPAPAKVANKVESKGVLKYDDDDLKYMTKQAYKIGERLSKAASRKFTPKQSSKRY